LSSAVRPFLVRLNAVTSGIIEADVNRNRHPAIPVFIVGYVRNRNNWHFNAEYVSGIKIINLPIEEILFFITVPFACLFTWEMIIRRAKEKVWNMHLLRLLLYLALPAGIYFFSIGKQYTGLTLSFIFLANIVDQFLKTNLLLTKDSIFTFCLLLFFTLIFNGYLTWRPVVTYGVDISLISELSLFRLKIFSTEYLCSG